MSVNGSTVTIVLLHILLCMYWFKAPTVLESWSNCLGWSQIDSDMEDDLKYIKQL